MILDAAHRVQGVPQQVQDDLLELDPISCDTGDAAKTAGHAQLLSFGQISAAAPQLLLTPFALGDIHHCADVFDVARFALQAVANAVHVFDHASWKEEPELSFKILFLSDN